MFSLNFSHLELCAVTSRGLRGVLFFFLKKIYYFSLLLGVRFEWADILDNSVTG